MKQVTREQQLFKRKKSVHFPEHYVLDIEEDSFENSENDDGPFGLETKEQIQSDENKIPVKRMQNTTKRSELVTTEKKEAKWRSERE